MAEITGTPLFQDHVRQLETSDPRHPATWNPNNETLINNDVFLKARSDATGLFSEGFMPVAGSTEYIYDGDRVSAVVHKDTSEATVATVSLVYDDENEGRVDYIEAVIAAPISMTIRETFTYDENNRITGSTRTVS